MSKYLDDILFFLGGLLIVAGFYVTLHLPGALFSGGVLLVASSFLIGGGKRDHQ